MATATALWELGLTVMAVAPKTYVRADAQNNIIPEQALTNVLGNLKNIGGEIRRCLFYNLHIKKARETITGFFMTETPAYSATTAICSAQVLPLLVASSYVTT